MTSTCHLTVVAPELISKLKFYEPEEELRENGFHAIPPWDHRISG